MIFYNSTIVRYYEITDDKELKVKLQIRKDLLYAFHE